MSKGFLSIWNPENHFTFYDILLSNLPYFSTAFPSLSKKPPAVSAVASRRRPPRSRRPRASGDVVAQSSGAAPERRSGPPLKPPGGVTRGKWSAGETWVAKVESFQSLMRPKSKQHSASSNFPSNALGCFGPRVCTVNTIPGDNGQVRKVLILVFIIHSCKTKGKAHLPELHLNLFEIMSKHNFLCIKRSSQQPTNVPPLAAWLKLAALATVLPLWGSLALPEEN